MSGHTLFAILAFCLVFFLVDRLFFGSSSDREARNRDRERREEEKRWQMMELCLAGELMDELQLVYGQAFKLSEGSTNGRALSLLTYAFASLNITRNAYNRKDAAACESAARQGLTYAHESLSLFRHDQSAAASLR